MNGELASTGRRGFAIEQERKTARVYECGRPGMDHPERKRESERERAMGQRSDEREIFFSWSLLDRGININGIGA